MIEINSHYPHSLSDKKIEGFIRDYSNAIFDARADINAVLRYTPLIQLGQNELQGRHTRRATWLSVGVAFLSLAIAMLALYVSLTSSKSSELWENRQLQLLEQTRNDMNNSNNKIIETIVKQNSNTTETITNSAKDIIVSLKKGFIRKKVESQPMPVTA